MDAIVARAPSAARARGALAFALAGAAVAIGHRLMLLAIFALLGPDLVRWQLAILVAWVLLMAGIAAIGYIAGTRRSRLDAVAGVAAAALATFGLGLVGW